MFDAIVVGARCAGAATAMLLAKHGHRVLLVDRTRFPSDTLSSHAIRIPGVARLARWGILDDVLASGAPPIRSFRFDLGPFAIEGSPRGIGNVDMMVAPRRTALDAMLADAAIRAGAELRERFRVTELVWRDGRVAGVRGETAAGRAVVEHAHIVIGADGMRSAVARAVEAPYLDARAPRTCNAYTYWEGVELVAGAELYPRDGLMTIANPTNDGLAMTIGLWPHAEADRVRADLDVAMDRALETASPSLAERVHAGRRIEAFRFTADLPFFKRRAHGPGWALVGDAACFKDPILAHGMNDAFLGAELLADALTGALGDDERVARRTAAYERELHRAVTPLYELAYAMADLAPPPPELQAAMAALPGNEEATTRFFSAVEGTMPVEAFFPAPPVEMSA